MKDRILQINSFIQRELGSLFSAELAPPSGIVITITKVSVAKDLKSGKVWIGIWPDFRTEEGLLLIRKQWRKLSHLLAQKMRTKFSPRLVFEVDNTEKEAFNMEHILDTLDMRGNRGE